MQINALFVISNIPVIFSLPFIAVLKLESDYIIGVCYGMFIILDFHKPIPNINAMAKHVIPFPKLLCQI